MLALTESCLIDQECNTCFLLLLTDALECVRGNDTATLDESLLVETCSSYNTIAYLHVWHIHKLLADMGIKCEIEV